MCMKKIVFPNEIYVKYNKSFFKYSLLPLIKYSAWFVAPSILMNVQ